VDGTVKWRSYTGAAITNSPAIGPDEAIYVANQDGVLSALRCSQPGKSGVLPSGSSGGLGTGAIVGIVFGTLFGVALLLVGALYLFRRHRLRTRKSVVRPPDREIASPSSRGPQVSQKVSDPWDPDSSSSDSEFPAHVNLVGEPPLPEGWTLHYMRETGEKYFYHAASNATSWDRPTGPDTFEPTGGRPLRRQTSTL